MKVYLLLLLFLCRPVYGVRTRSVSNDTRLSYHSPYKDVPEHVYGMAATIVKMRRLC